MNESGSIDEDEIAAYLRDNPDFLKDNPNLMDILNPPSRWKGDGNVVDMQSVMLDRLRNESENLKDAANLLISTTRSNMLIQTRTHASVIAILGADSFEKLVHVVCYDMPILLDVNAVSLCFETGEKGHPDLGENDIKWLAPGSVDKMLGGPGEFAKLLEHTSDDSKVFGESAGLVKSAALARLQIGERLDNAGSFGLMAFGARNRGSFHGGQGTDLLLFISRVLEISLLRWLPTNQA